MPTLKIDEREITVERGSTVLQAAHRLGIEIPTFCYHPGLTIAANCRMCLVEVKNARKPLPACHAQVADGMEVFTNTDKVKDTQRAILEFILLNHPVDCPICDQAGECVLQDHYKDYSTAESRLAHTKVHKAKAKILGPTVVLDAERCILCTRCVRFCNEITKTDEIQVMDRGEHSEITTFPGNELANPYSLNVVDICPVGALTSRDFRFQRRVWFIDGTRTTCTECAKGCNIRVDSFKNRVERHTPQYNPQVNEWWMCDSGRLAHHRWAPEQLHDTPWVVRGGERQAVVAREAADAMAQAIQASQSTAFVLSPNLTNEELWVALALAKTAKAALYLGGRASVGEDDELLIRADKNANRAGVQALTAGVSMGSVDDFIAAAAAKKFGAALVFGSEHAWPAHAAAALAQIGTLGVIVDRRETWVDTAHIVMPAASPAMRRGTLVNSDGRVQLLRRAIRLEPAGVVFPHWRIAKRISQSLGAELPWGSEEDVLAAISQSVPAFAGITMDGLGDYGLPLGQGGQADVDPAEAHLLIDRCAPQWRAKNVNSRMPWQH